LTTRADKSSLPRGQQKVRGKSIFPRVVGIGGRTISGRGKHPLLKSEARTRGQYPPPPPGDCR